MTQPGWESTTEQNKQVYVLGDFSVRGSADTPGRTFWIAKHNNQEIKRGTDLQEVMDYCERMNSRLQ